MKIRNLDLVTVHEPDGAYARTGEVRGGRTSQSAYTDDENRGSLETELACVFLLGGWISVLTWRGPYLACQLD